MTRNLLKLTFIAMNGAKWKIVKTYLRQPLSLFLFHTFCLIPKKIPSDPKKQERMNERNELHHIT